MIKPTVFLDNEGPCTRNDNAFEFLVMLAEEYGLGRETGVKFFLYMSTIDDIWGDSLRLRKGDFRQLAKKDPQYSSGHTLKIILPFLRAMGGTTEQLYKFSKESIQLIPNIEIVLKELMQKEFNLWQVSTSYGPFIRAFCDKVGFDFARTCCTRLNDFDKIPLSRDEAEMLLDFMQRVVDMPLIEYDAEAMEILPEHEENYKYVTEFVWEIVSKIPIGKLFRTVLPVGQTQKREAVENICNIGKIPKGHAMYVGDSQTDVQCVDLLRSHGLTMMFNGSGPVCASSDLMYIGNDARAISEVAGKFAELGRKGVIQHYTSRKETEDGGIIGVVTPNSINELHEMSTANRKQLRGVDVGSLP